MENKQSVLHKIWVSICSFFAVLFLAETNYSGTVENPLPDPKSDDKE